MRKIYVFLAVILLVVLILGVGFFIISLGNLAHFFGKQSQQIIVDERTQFVGTWEEIGQQTLHTFAYTGLYSIDQVPAGTWDLENGLFRLSYDDGQRVDSYEYVFSNEENWLTLTDEFDNQTMFLRS